jgi:hypothetical protein
MRSSSLRTSPQCIEWFFTFLSIERIYGMKNRSLVTVPFRARLCELAASPSARAGFTKFCAGTRTFSANRGSPSIRSMIRPSSESFRVE